jgi:hypothetical protein
MVYTQSIHIHDFPLDYTRRDVTVSKCVDDGDLYNSLQLYSFHITLYVVSFTGILELWFTIYNLKHCVITL